MYVRGTTSDRMLTVQDYPIRNWQEHSREVFCVDWNNLEKELFASSSWDGSVKVVCGPVRETQLTRSSGILSARTPCRRSRPTMRVSTSVPGRRTTP